MFDFFDYSYFNNSVSAYLLAGVIMLSGFIGVKIFRKYLLGRLTKMALKTANTLDDFLVKILDKLMLPFLHFVVIYLAIKTLNLNPYLVRAVNVLSMAFVTVFFSRFILELITYAFLSYWSRNAKNLDLEHSLNGILKVIKFIVWSLAAVFFLDNLGFKISTVIAGLGIGGIAIALAAQAVLKDLFSYFSIIFDRPFEVGDFIIIDDLLGSVEHVGIKTTRIRSLSGEQLVFSNSDLTDSRLRNYKRMGKRRVSFKLGVVYDTSLDKLKAIPGVIKEIITGVQDTVFDRAHFFTYGDFSLVFEIVYYVLGSDYNKYMDIQQAINIKIKEEFQNRSIEFAFPTQTLYLEK
ncbi:MAG: mechanosensitive ion channel family protein [Candidatus Omnitrophica bacterium]|nr:mechanosensitive ion channel family protein [Candidatus Omnitrophota bacterium]MDD5429741.1 mechanosensitive ion channel family protein [Candidatus Omnitrophota bacterium]